MNITNNISTASTEAVFLFFLKDKMDENIRVYTNLSYICHHNKLLI